MQSKFYVNKKRDINLDKRKHKRSKQKQKHYWRLARHMGAVMVKWRGYPFLFLEKKCLPKSKH